MPTTDRTRRGGWARWPLRVTSTVSAVLLFDQAVFAGQFLSGSYDSLHTHRENATLSGIAVLCSLASAVVLRWPGRGPIWPIFATAGLFGMIALQIVLGFARLISLHIPLGVATILCAGLLAVWSWRGR